MTLTRTDKRFVTTVAVILMLGATAVWMEHGHGRRQGVARVMEFHRVSADEASFPAMFSPTGKYWTPASMRWRIPERFRARVLLEGEERWISVPLELSPLLESGELLLTYKRNREGEVKIYRIGRGEGENGLP